MTSCRRWAYQSTLPEILGVSKVFVLVQFAVFFLSAPPPPRPEIVLSRCSWKSWVFNMCFSSFYPQEEAVSWSLSSTSFALSWGEDPWQIIIWVLILIVRSEPRGRVTVGSALCVLVFFWSDYALHLQSRHCTAWATPPVHFYSGYFLRWGLVLWTVYPGWSQNVILPILASQVARITGVSHWCLAGSVPV
jgi:hypothetical protein